MTPVSLIKRRVNIATVNVQLHKELAVKQSFQEHMMCHIHTLSL